MSRIARYGPFHSLDCGENAAVPLRIPLSVSKKGPGAAAHPYPFEIGLQTLEFLQASLFYAAFTDIATGEFVRLPDGMKRLESRFTEKLYSKAAYDETWGYLAKYFPVFERVPFQSVLISLNSHWDWYLRKLVDFIIFSRAHTGGPVLSNAETRRLERCGRLPIVEQIDVVELSSGVSLGLAEEERTELKEMTLARNLGLHNRWEVDAQYLANTSRLDLEFGDLLLVEVEKLYQWHKLLIRLVNESSSKVGVAFVAAPDFR